ncbi:hypothetical protein DPMN_102311 [Dreissena polymorpha]|uniref:Uncharacterized protein n=1 Tax=Dreissena polymorpha TaxID=45954 RepID=A0A9D4LKQ4_DREPO|nr:hypothetical protein DPMN_102311 [Dreissena polymorpha]
MVEDHGLLFYDRRVKRRFLYGILDNLLGTLKRCVNGNTVVGVDNFRLWLRFRLGFHMM